jgi:hypothetical protein
VELETQLFYWQIGGLPFVVALVLAEDSGHSSLAGWRIYNFLNENVSF